MKSFDVGRYILKETSLSIIINIIMDVGPPVIASSLNAPSHGASEFDLILSVAPQLMLSGLMSALVPVLLTRRRRLKGILPGLENEIEPPVAKVVFVAGAAMLISATLGIVFLRTILQQLAGREPGAAAMLIFDGLFGATVAATVTPLALIVFFGRSWRRFGWSF